MNLRTLALPLMLSTVAFLGACKKDACKDVTCQNGGSCTDGSCVCPAGFEGSNCEVSTRAKFLGFYNVTETCPGEVYSYTFTITAGPSSATAIIIDNITGWGPITGTVSGNGLTIPTQQVTEMGDIVTVVGSGQISGNTLNMSYTLSADGESTSCTAIGTRN